MKTTFYQIQTSDGRPIYSNGRRLTLEPESDRDRLADVPVDELASAAERLKPKFGPVRFVNPREINTITP